MMVELLVHGYATGVSSSRMLARKPHEDVAVCLLGAGNIPAHSVRSNFQAFHLLKLSQ